MLFNHEIHETHENTFALSRALVYFAYFVVHIFSYIFSYLGIGSRIPPDFA